MYNQYTYSIQSVYIQNLFFFPLTCMSGRISESHEGKGTVL